MDNMKDETLNKLVVMLADEMTKRIYGISKQENRDDLVFYADDDEDHCLGELARLMTLSSIYEQREEDEIQAAIVRSFEES